MKWKTKVILWLLCPSNYLKLNSQDDLPWKCKPKSSKPRRRFFARSFGCPETLEHTIHTIIFRHWNLIFIYYVLSSSLHLCWQAKRLTLRLSSGFPKADNLPWVSDTLCWCQDLSFRVAQNVLFNRGYQWEWINSFTFDNNEKWKVWSLDFKYILFCLQLYCAIVYFFVNYEIIKNWQLFV